MLGAAYITCEDILPELFELRLVGNMLISRNLEPGYGLLKAIKPFEELFALVPYHLFYASFESLDLGDVICEIMSKDVIYQGLRREFCIRVVPYLEPYELLMNLLKFILYVSGTNGVQKPYVAVVYVLSELYHRLSVGMQRPLIFHVFSGGASFGSRRSW